MKFSFTTKGESLGDSKERISTGKSLLGHPNTKLTFGDEINTLIGEQNPG